MPSLRPTARTVKRLLRLPFAGLRPLFSTRRRMFSAARAEGDTFNVTFIEDGEKVEATVAEGQSILEAAHANEIELEGACDAQLACSTCHVILPKEIYDTLDEPCDEELDMLDLAIGVAETSRLGCQVKLTKSMEGMQIEIPPSMDLR